jgi:membrane-associated protein
VPGGELRLEWVLAAAIAGALLGDGSAFWIGHRSQREILSAWPLASYPRVVAQSEAFFCRWGALAVFFARFVAPIRAFVPITAGALGMPPLTFYAVNIPAILLWAPAHVLPGVLAVSALHKYAGFEHHAGIAKHYWMLAVIGGALIVALVVWAIRRRHGGGLIEPAAKPVRKSR